MAAKFQFPFRSKPDNSSELTQEHEMLIPHTANRGMGVDIWKIRVFTISKKKKNHCQAFDLLGDFVVSHLCLFGKQECKLKKRFD